MFRFHFQHCRLVILTLPHLILSPFAYICSAVFNFAFSISIAWTWDVYCYWLNKQKKLDFRTFFSYILHILQFGTYRQNKNNVALGEPFCQKIGSKRAYVLELWTEMSRKYMATDKCIFRGMVQDSTYGVTSWLLAWCCHRQLDHEVVLWTTKTTIKLNYLLKIKAWEKNNKSLNSVKEKGIPSSCPWFVTSTTRQALSWIAHHGHLDGIPLSLPECSDRFY